MIVFARTSRSARIFSVLVMVLGLALASLPNWAKADTPMHLIDIAKSLTKSALSRDDVFADAEVRRDVISVLREVRFQSWRTSPPTVQFDVDYIADKLGYYGEEDTARLLNILKAETDEETRVAWESLVQCADCNVDAEIEKRQNALAGQLRALAADLETETLLEVGDDRALIFAWDPGSGDTTLTVDRGINGDRTILRGNTRPNLDDDGNVTWIYADHLDSVTHSTPEDLDALARNAFGTWVTSDGNIWEISQGAVTKGQSNELNEARLRQTIADIKKEIEATRKARKHFWRASDGSIVTQDTYENLTANGDFTYLSDRLDDESQKQLHSLNERLQAKRADLDAGIDRFAAFEPTAQDGLTRQTPEPITITVTQPNGYVYTYDTAEFDGRRITAQRRLRDAGDMGDLPRDIIEELAAHWHPPEWIELETVQDEESGALKLSGSSWRLEVTYGGMTRQSVSNIHSPWDTKLILTPKLADIYDIASSVGPDFQF
jgi:hypothetical protein